MYDNQSKSPSIVSGYCAPGVVPRDEPGACKVTRHFFTAPPGHCIATRRLAAALWSPGADDHPASAPPRTDEAPARRCASEGQGGGSAQGIRRDPGPARLIFNEGSSGPWAECVGGLAEGKARNGSCPRMQSIAACGFRVCLLAWSSRTVVCAAAAAARSLITVIADPLRPVAP